MLLTITGTPGTGKTSVAEELDWKTVDLTEFIEQEGIGEEKHGEFEVDPEELVQALEERVETDEDILIEGHLAHHFPADYCVVLRCRPDILRERLSERDYSDDKVEENVEAEALDLILSEAVEKQDNIIEVDTTDREVSEIAAEINRRIEEKDTGYGEIDWTEYL